MEGIKNILDIQQFQDFDNLDFIAREVVEGFITGLHRSPFHGFSAEFSEHRLYNTGESTKHIDWKLYGRTERLYVKQFEEETNLRCQIVLDVSSSMLFPYHKGDRFNQNKLAFSVFSAAALIYLFRKQRDASGLTLFSDDIDFHADARMSSVHFDLMFKTLTDLLNPKNAALKKKTCAVDVLHQIAENIHKRSLVIIFSDMLQSEDPDQLYHALQHLRYNKHEVVLFHVVDKEQEQNFEYSGRPHKFVDLETGEQLRLRPNELKDAYRKYFVSYFNDLKNKCGQFNIDLVEADINNDFRHILQTYLIKRGRIG